MVTYASRPPQADRLEQPVQKRQSKATAPSVAPTSDSGVLSGVTLSPSGAMTPAIRLKRAEHSSGLVGRSSDKQAVSKTSEVVASVSDCIGPSQGLDHGSVQSPDESTAKLRGTVNTPRFQFNWPFFLAFFVLAPAFAVLTVKLAFWAYRALSASPGLTQ